MNTVEFMRLIDFLRNKVEDEHFDLSCWLRMPNGELQKRTRCGTIGCAIGLGISQIPEWKEQGFTMRGDSGDPIFDEAMGFRAIAKFFGIDANDALDLFTGSGYPNHDKASRHQVADKIEAFINKHKEVNTCS